MSLERPYSRASSAGGRPPPTPPPTYLWEELRRSRSRGGYPWTHLDKEPLPDYLDSETLLRGEIPSEYVNRCRTTEKRSRNRYRFHQDRDRGRRARSEPTPSIPSSSITSLQIMDQAMAADPSGASSEIDEFPLADEDIPDFVMAYLQSDKGNLDEEIPDHILEYIQSRAAVLEKTQPLHKHHDNQPDELYYTENELRILDEARRRLEEQGELPGSSHSGAAVAGQDAFDQYFQRAIILPQAVPETKEPEETKAKKSHTEEAEASKKSGKFSFRGISMPIKPQLNIKLPKFGQASKKNPKNDEDEGAEAPAKKQRRPHSTSPMRQKINQQLESWNNSLKKFKARSKNQDGQVKGFVALLPGRSKAKPKEQENQYEEVGKQRTDIEAPREHYPVVTLNVPDNAVPIEDAVGCSPIQHISHDGEETMEDIENLPESEVADGVDNNANGIIVDREVADALVPSRSEDFVDIDIDDDDFEEDEEFEEEVQQVPEEANKEAPRLGGLAARSRKVFQDTKSKIRTSLSKEQLQATRNKLQSTLSKKNLQATHKKIQSTTKETLQATRSKLQSTKQNLQATGEKLQTTFTGSLKKKKPDSLPATMKENIFSAETQGDQREYETSTPVFSKAPPQMCDEEIVPCESVPPKVNKRTKKRKEPTSKSSTSLTYDIEEETEEDVEDELEPKMEFSLHGVEKTNPSSVSQSTETLPEGEVESDKENVVVRPKRHRYRHRRHGFHEEFDRPRSANYESDNSNIRSSWIETRQQYPTLSQEMLGAFAIPVNSLEAVNSHWGSPRKPERPSRASKKRVNEYHYYSNVPPLRAKRHRQQNSEWSTNTWPRQQDASVKKPIAPKRLKAKQRSTKSLEVRDNQPAWHKYATVEPVAPRRTRSKNLLNTLRQHEQPKSNILVDADTLFGVDSRFIDDDDDVEERIKEHNRQENILASIDYNIKMDESMEAEPKIVNRIPEIPGRRKMRTMTKTKPMPSPRSEEATWPRSSRPSAPRRIKRGSVKKTSNETDDTHLNLCEPTRKMPTVPASTPSEAHETTEGMDTDGTSSIQAGLDHILEILATFPQQESHSPPNDTAVQEEAAIVQEEPQTDIKTTDLDENPYAEIKQFQEKKCRPPRPPPPAYAPPSVTSSYSYIYTVPRRKNKAHPERPPRTYCTLRPHKPPRIKRRTRTQEISCKQPDVVEEAPFVARRHSFSAVDDTQTREETNKDLQSSPIINRMRVRPLPPPPRNKRRRSRSPPSKPPRSRTASLRRPVKSEQCDDEPETLQPLNSSDIVSESSENRGLETEESLAVVNADEYEPIESPPKVEEISVGIQTDPLPDHEIDNEATVIEESQDLEPPAEPVEDQCATSIEVSSPMEPGETQTGQMTWTAATSPDVDLPQGNADSSDHGKCPKKEPEETHDKPVKTHGDAEDEDGIDSYSRMPPDFPLRVPFLPPIRLDLPTRLQLSELEVERLNVREVTAERLVISSVDANSLQVSQMTSVSGPFSLNFVGPSASTPSPNSSLIPQATEEVAQTSITASSSREEPVQVPHQSATIGNVLPSEPQAASEELNTGTKEREVTRMRERRTPCADVGPTTLSRQDWAEASNQPTAEPSVGDLTMQLVSISARNIARQSCSVVKSTYSMAQRVAELGLQQLNEQLQRRGIFFDDKEREDIKAVLLMLLLVISAIFLLGLGKQRLSNHWDFYFPN